MSVIKDVMSVCKAAEVYNVPKSTLGDRVSGRLGSKSGPQKILAVPQEDCLVQIGVHQLVLPSQLRFDPSCSCFSIRTTSCCF